MLANIPWSSYLITVFIFIIIWYLIMLFKFHSNDLKKILYGEKKLRIPVLKKASKNLQQTKSISDSFLQSFDTLEEAEKLSQRIVNAVKESIGKGFSKQQFENYLSMLLEEYPYVKISSLKADINHLIVAESSKHPNLLLTLSEADSLWEGPVF